MLIVGTGGMGKEVLGALVTYTETEDICFFDDDKDIPNVLFGKYNVMHSLEEAREYLEKTDNKFIAAVGHPRLRAKLTRKFEAIGGILANIICSDVFMFPFNDQYQGLFAHPGVGISHGVKLGKGCVLHINASIGHDTNVGDYVTIGPGAAVVGPCEIGGYTYIGSNATVLPNTRVGENAIIGAGVVVDRDLAANESFLGNRD